MANLKLMNNEMAVSPIVATLVLIVVAVIGAVAVGTIMGTFSTDVSKQANSGNAASQAQTEIIVAGSTTLQPLELNLKTDYELAHPGIKINVQGGGSGAGVSSVAMGISDIGASSAASKVTSAQASNPSSTDYQNLYVALIGGRGVAWITNGATSGVTSAVQADLKTAYAPASTDANGVVTATITSIPTGTIMVQRADSSGTQDDASTWVGGSTGYIGAGHAVGKTGNDGVLSYISTTPNTLGFVDAGYALNNPAGITILPVTDSTGTYTMTAAHVKAALKGWYHSTAQGADYPQGLVGGMYWITKGTSPTKLSSTGLILNAGQTAASSTVKNLINFAQSPAEQPAFAAAGDYALADFV